MSLEASALVITRPALAWYGSSWGDLLLELVDLFRHLVERSTLFKLNINHTAVYAFAQRDSH